MSDMNTINIIKEKNKESLTILFTTLFMQAVNESEEHNNVKQTLINYPK